MPPVGRFWLRSGIPFLQQKNGMPAGIPSEAFEKDRICCTRLPTLALSKSGDMGRDIISSQPAFASSPAVLIIQCVLSKNNRHNSRICIKQFFWYHCTSTSSMRKLSSLPAISWLASRVMVASSLAVTVTGKGWPVTLRRKTRWPTLRSSEPGS